MPLCQSYFPNYFSLDDILASQERLPCKTEVILSGLGFLDVSSESADLQPGTKLELPHWLAQPLQTKRFPIISIEVPKIYKEAYRQILIADATAVDLNKWCTYFYEFGIHLTSYKHRECDHIQDILLETFKSRFRLVMDWTQNTGKDPTIGLQLPILERNIFLTGRKSRCLLTDWLKQGCGDIETSEIVANHKKRKRAELEGENI